MHIRWLHIQINSVILLVVSEVVHVEAGEANVHTLRKYPSAQSPVVHTMEVQAVGEYLVENAEGDTVVAIAEQLARCCIWNKKYFAYHYRGEHRNL